MEPLISIITASYNKERYISETIESVLKQTYSNWELLIIDDLSTDDTIKIVESYLKIDDRIRLFKNKNNNGANFCRNQGIKESKGEYVVFLDADDVLIPSCIENRLKVIYNTSYDFCVFTSGTFYNVIGDNENIWYPQSKKPLLDFLSHTLPWQIMQPMWKKNTLVDVNGFDEAFNRLQDVELHTRVLLNRNITYKQIIAKPDCYYRIDEERKNFSTFQLLKRWADSSVLYCQKFHFIVNKSHQKYLIGTILKTYFQIILNFKQNKITKNEFDTLRSILFLSNTYTESNLFKKSLFNFFYFYNLYLFKIPGINWLFYKLIVL